MFKVGDKVRVKKYLKESMFSQRKVVCGKMTEFAGKIVTISASNMRGDFYIEEDDKKHCWTEGMFEEIKEDKNMKELTFREVIANIKEGEEYKVVGGRRYRLEHIYMSKGDIIFRQKNGCIVTDRVVVDDKTKFVKVREEYTFKEAFEAFEKGKEIESCESGGIYNINGGEENWLFYAGEIRGKWYIND